MYRVGSQRGLHDTLSLGVGAARNAGCAHPLMAGESRPRATGIQSR